MNDKSVIPVMVNGAGIRDTRGREYADYYYDPGQISGNIGANPESNVSHFPKTVM